MIHDRLAFGGALLAVAVLYAWLTLFPLQRGQPGPGGPWPSGARGLRQLPGLPGLWLPGHMAWRGVAPAPCRCLPSACGERVNAASSPIGLATLLCPLGAEVVAEAGGAGTALPSRHGCRHGGGGRRRPRRRRHAGVCAGRPGVCRAEPGCAGRHQPPLDPADRARSRGLGGAVCTTGLLRAGHRLEGGALALCLAGNPHERALRLRRRHRMHYPIGYTTLSHTSRRPGRALGSSWSGCSRGLLLDARRRRFTARATVRYLAADAGRVILVGPAVEEMVGAATDAARAEPVFHAARCRHHLPLPLRRPRSPDPRSPSAHAARHRRSPCASTCPTPGSLLLSALRDELGLHRHTATAAA